MSSTTVSPPFSTHNFFRPQLVVSRSPIASGPELSPSVKSGGTKSRLSSSSASSPSNVSSVKSPRTSRYAAEKPFHSTTRSDSTLSRPISASSPLPSWPSRRPLRLTSSPSSRTPTWPLSTQSVLPSSPRISPLLAGYAESVHRFLLFISLIWASSVLVP